jgi:hypothetical protein
MNPKNPPAMASWMLEHLILGDKNEALAGDLLEDFRRGRSAAWYWRQVLVAIVFGFTRELRAQWPAMTYAALWAVPVPVFSVRVVGKIGAIAFLPRRWQLAWPYSTICDLALFFGCHLFYVWLGLVLYFLLFSWATSGLRLRRLARSLWVSVFVYVAVNMGLIAFFALFPPHARYMIDVRHVTAVRLITDSLFLECLPFFLTLLIPIWAAFPRLQDRTMRMAH